MSQDAVKQESSGVFPGIRRVLSSCREVVNPRSVLHATFLAYSWDMGGTGWDGFPCAALQLVSRSRIAPSSLGKFSGNSILFPGFLPFPFSSLVLFPFQLVSPVAGILAWHSSFISGPGPATYLCHPPPLPQVQALCLDQS